MIDEKKIKEVARAYCDAIYGTLKEEPFIAEAFRQGAIWAQNEFINSLWHNASEEPKKGVTFLVSMRNHGDHKISYYLDDSGDVLETFISWSAYVSYFGVTHWCYLSDILPKEGDEG